MPTNANSRPDEEHQLYVPLTHEQLLMKGRHLAGYELQHARIKQEAADKAAEYSKQLKALEAHIKATSADIDREEHLVPVLCTWVLEGKTWRLYRTDNPLAKPLTEQVATQAELAAARQGEMFS